MSSTASTSVVSTSFLPPSSALDELGWYPPTIPFNDVPFIRSQPKNFAKPALLFQSFRYDRATAQADADYTTALHQLLPRGLNYEPMATGVKEGDGEVVTLLDKEVSEALDYEQLMEVVRQAVGVGEGDSATSATTSSSSSSSSSSDSAVWPRVAVVCRDYCLFGSPLLDSDGTLLGFLRMLCTETLTRPFWIGPGETEQDREAFSDEVREWGVQGPSFRLSLLPLLALQTTLLPTLTSFNAEQGELATLYLEHVITTLKQRRLQGELRPADQHTGSKRLYIGDEVLMKYLCTIPHIIFWPGVSKRSRKAPHTSSSSINVSSSASAAALILFSCECFAHRCTQSMSNFFKMQTVKLSVEQAHYASSRPYILDPNRHPHGLELTGEEEVKIGQAPDMFKCNVCKERGEHARYVCRECSFAIHIHCVSREGVEVLSEAQRKKRKRDEATKKVERSSPRGPFIVFSVYYKHGEYSTQCYNTAEQLREACTNELQELRSEKRGEEADRETTEQKGEVEVEGADLTLDDLVLLVMRRTNELAEERYNWCEVVEGGKLMKTE